MPSRSLLDALLGDDAIPDLPPADVALARSAIRAPASADPEKLACLPAPLVEAVLQASVKARVSALAEALSLSKDKSLAKLAKKALYQLKSSGVEVAAPAKPAEPVKPQPEAVEEFPCFLSPVSGTGERAVLLHHFHGPRLETLYVVIQDELGAVECSVGEITRGKFAKMVKTLRSEQRADVEIPFDEARQIVAEAAALNLATRTPFPPGFSDAMRHFDIRPLERPFEVPPVQEGDDRLTLEGHTLHNAPEIATWMPSEGDLRLLAQKFAAIESSPLELTSAQRTDQLMQAVRAQARREGDSPDGDAPGDADRRRAGVRSAAGRESEPGWADSLDLRFKSWPLEKGETFPSGR
jgi:hypothetical protein